MRVHHVKQMLGAVAVAASALAAVACGDVARSGRSPAYLVLDKLEASRGYEPDKFFGNLLSDVQTLVKKKVGDQEFLVPTVYNDLGRVTLRIGLKNPGPTSSPTSPSALNTITITRYRVVFVRADGRNTQGVDVPYAFDGGVTVTVPAEGTAIAAFELVRHTAKEEPPLRNLINNGGAQIIATLAEVTLWGKDQAGNDVTVSGTITVDFGDFGDPA